MPHAGAVQQLLDGWGGGSEHLEHKLCLQPPEMVPGTAVTLQGLLESRLSAQLECRMLCCIPWTFSGLCWLEQGKLSRDWEPTASFCALLTPSLSQTLHLREQEGWGEAVLLCFADFIFL